MVFKTFKKWTLIHYENSQTAFVTYNLHQIEIILSFKNSNWLLGHIKNKLIISKTVDTVMYRNKEIDWNFFFVSMKITSKLPIIPTVVNTDAETKLKKY